MHRLGPKLLQFYFYSFSPRGAWVVGLGSWPATSPHWRQRWEGARGVVRPAPTSFFLFLGVQLRDMVKRKFWKGNEMQS